MSVMKKNKRNRKVKIIQIIINIIMVMYIIGFFIIFFFFLNFYTIAIFSSTWVVFIIVSVIICPECQSGNSKKSSKMGTTEMPDKPINATE